MTNTKEQGLYNYRHVWQRTKNKGISMNRQVMYTYEYANSAWKNNELKQSHTIEGVLKSSCPVQRCMCITLYLHCDTIAKKKKNRRTSNDLQNIHRNLKIQQNEHRCSGKDIISCSTSGCSLINPLPQKLLFWFVIHRHLLLYDVELTAFHQ